MNNLGRNETLWLKKQGCIFVDEEHEEWQIEGDYSTSIWTKEHEYVGLADLGKHEDNVNFIYKHKLTNLMSINRAKGLPLSEYGCNTVSIGFNEKDQEWYGWTHRGYGHFGIGYEVVKDCICDCGTHKYPFKVKTIEEAKQLAIDIAEYLN